jgi:hypothetical protein
MSNNRNGLGVTLAVVGDAAVGFPIALLVLAVVAVVGALVWRAVSRKRSNE